MGTYVYLVSGALGYEARIKNEEDHFLDDLTMTSHLGEKLVTAFNVQHGKVTGIFRKMNEFAKDYNSKKNPSLPDLETAVREMLQQK